MTFHFIEEHREQWPVRLLCDALDVSTAGYYAWRERPVSAQQQRQDALLVEIRAIHAEVRARYGSPRVHAELAARGQDCCVNTVAKLMHDHDIRAKTARKFRCTTDSNHDLPLQKRMMGRPTLVLFLGDNGPLPTFNRQRTAGLRGSKLSLYEGGIRVPCIAWGTRRIPAGVTNEATVFATVDLLPTLCALCRCQPPKGYRSDSEDLSAALLGKTPKRTRPLFWE